MTKVTVEHNAQKEPEDIFFQGNLVISDDEDKLIVLVTKSSGNYFNGVMVGENRVHSHGYHYSGLLKNIFKQFHGKIILES